jgi:hypothetical protein
MGQFSVSEMWSRSTGASKLVGLLAEPRTHQYPKGSGAEHVVTEDVVRSTLIDLINKETSSPEIGDPKDK